MGSSVLQNCNNVVFSSKTRDSLSYWVDLPKLTTISMGKDAISFRDEYNTKLTMKSVES